MYLTPAATYPLTEYFQAIARSGRFWHDRPFPRTSPSCTFTETKSLLWPGDASTAPFSSHSLWCSAKQLSMNSLLPWKGVAIPAKAQGFSQASLLYRLDKHSRWGLIWKPQVLGLMHKNKATVEKSPQKCINLNSVYFGLTITTFIKSNDPVPWVILQTHLLGGGGGEEERKNLYTPPPLLI